MGISFRGVRVVRHRLRRHHPGPADPHLGADQYPRRPPVHRHMGGQSHRCAYRRSRRTPASRRPPPSTSRASPSRPCSSWAASRRCSWRPTCCATSRRGELAGAGIVPVAILVATTSVMASPSVADQPAMTPAIWPRRSPPRATRHGRAGTTVPRVRWTTATAYTSATPWPVATGTMNTQAFWKQNPPADSARRQPRRTSARRTAAPPRVRATARRPGVGAADRPEPGQGADERHRHHAVVAEKLPDGERRQERRLHPGHEVRPRHRVALGVPHELGRPARPRQPRDAPLRRLRPLTRPDRIGPADYSLAATAPATDANAPIWVKYMPTHYHQGLCVKNALVIGGDNSDAASCAAKAARSWARPARMAGPLLAAQLRQPRRRVQR